MDLELSGKRAFVSGASKGIGKAVAEGLAAEGCHLDLAARSLGDLEALADSLRFRFGVAVRTYAVDVSEADGRDMVRPFAAKADILVNCAGAIPAGNLDQVSEQQWRAGWDLKVFGYFEMTRMFYAAMAARGNGVIVNIIGDASERPRSDYIAGSSGNASLVAFTQALGASAPDHGVRVVGVNPGLTASDRALAGLRKASLQKFGSEERWPEIVGGLGLPFGRLAKPGEVADIVTFLASPRASYISGTVVTVDGGRRFRDPDRS